MRDVIENFTLTPFSVTRTQFKLDGFNLFFKLNLEKTRLVALRYEKSMSIILIK